ncbi:hypothetical protein ACJ72_05816 [Emergomyces africanus]|uniref:Aminoglycoside phosphotransferase domain-containing protein n=1 Tax=Emergomyces africanus TaxID=1955775 RepID=A0A1B7NT26_9EURO|nr:hypothetical protein ACJ72_05816 [Emergomyces africanus]
MLELITVPSQGVLFTLANLHEGKSYIKRDGMLFEYSQPLTRPVNPDDLPTDGEVITVLAKQMGRVLLMKDYSYISKTGRSVRPSEAEAMRLVEKHTFVPVPNVIYALFNDTNGDIGMTIIPGSSLDKHWESLDDKTKQSLCRRTWDLISMIRQIPQKPELKHLFQCAADGSPTLDPLIQDIQQPPTPLETDSQLRSRIYERYIRYGGSRYRDQLLDMLPHSSSSVFTHADIAPRNIMVDENYQITGLLDWEYSGWYPDYWEYAQIMRPACQTGDWQSWMNATAPQKWDISGIAAARRILF